MQAYKKQITHSKNRIFNQSPVGLSNFKTFKCVSHEWEHKKNDFATGPVQPTPIEKPINTNLRLVTHYIHNVTNKATRDLKKSFTDNWSYISYSLSRQAWNFFHYLINCEYWFLLKIYELSTSFIRQVFDYLNEWKCYLWTDTLTKINLHIFTYFVVKCN